jgi:HAD superfamily hydrolase (TIGR01509 family)
VSRSAPAAARYAELVADQKVLPCVLDYVADARRLGLRPGVASSSSRDWVAGHLERMGLLARFDALACRGDVPRTKPDPGLHLRVLEALEVRPEEAIALEDSPNGIAAAKAAGLFCVAVPNDLTRGLTLSGADLRLGSLAELPLPQLLEQV